MDSNNNFATPLLSVLIATYNRSSLLIKAVESALSQTYTNIEVIISDDCSSDNTTDVVAEIISKDNRVRYYKNSKNLGMVKNAKTLLKYANGEYCIYLCDDDAFMDNKYFEDAVKLINRNPNLLLVNAASLTIDKINNTECINTLDINDGIYSGKSLILGRKNVFLTYNTCIIKKDILEKFYENCADDNLSIDLETVLLAYVSGDIGYINRTVAYWMYHEQSMGQQGVGIKPKAHLPILDAFWKSYLVVNADWRTNEIEHFKREYLDQNIRSCMVEYMLAGHKLTDFLNDLNSRNSELGEYSRCLLQVDESVYEESGKIVIFGAGGYFGKKLLTVAEIFNADVTGLVDDAITASSHAGYPVLLPNEIPADVSVVVAISDYSVFNNVTQVLKNKYGIKQNRIVWFYDWLLLMQIKRYDAGESK